MGTISPPDASAGQTGFELDRLGVRVPAILVLPFIQKGMAARRGA
ncbi:Hypothetical protein A7982_09910 [Minicystis rosea]|nr:Hypothetical protein A7982_09910 [Minicystis rosea]